MTLLARLNTTYLSDSRYIYFEYLISLGYASVTFEPQNAMQFMNAAHAVQYMEKNRLNPSTFKPIEFPDHVQCGNCLNKWVAKDDTKCIEFKPQHFAHICRDCMPHYATNPFVKPFLVKAP